MKLERKKTSELVLEELKKMIKAAEFPPNSKLPSETELAKRFDVSRAPIREALSVLAASGVIESKQGGGSWIKDVDLAKKLESPKFAMIRMEEVLHLLEMRMIIESEAAFLAAQRHTQADLKDLANSLEIFSLTVTDSHTVGFEADYDFHRIIVRSARNPFLTQTMDNLSDLHMKAVEFSLSKNLDWEVKRKEVYEEHEKIYEAIKNRDCLGAKHAVIAHLTNASNKLRNFYFPDENNN